VSGKDRNSFSKPFIFIRNINALHYCKPPLGDPCAEQNWRGTGRLLQSGHRWTTFARPSGVAICKSKWEIAARLRAFMKARLAGDTGQSKQGLQMTLILPWTILFTRLIPPIFFLCPQIPPSQRCAISFRVGLPRTLHAQSLLRHHAPGLRWVPDLPGEGAAGSARTRPRRPNAHILELAARRARRFLWPPRGAMVRGMQQLPHPANLSVLA